MGGGIALKTQASNAINSEISNPTLTFSMAFVETANWMV